MLFWAYIKVLVLFTWSTRLTKKIWVESRFYKYFLSHFKSRFWIISPMIYKGNLNEIGEYNLNQKD